MDKGGTAITKDDERKCVSNQGAFDMDTYYEKQQALPVKSCAEAPETCSLQARDMSARDANTNVALNPVLLSAPYADYTEYSVAKMGIFA